MQFLRSRIFPGGIMAHWCSQMRSPGLAGELFVSNSLIALPCLSIPIGLVHFVRRPRDISFRWTPVFCEAFIMVCSNENFKAAQEPA
jgi:hypothetical protein